ncbi:MAG: N-acetylneuraminate synthase family protein [bacterium]
MNRTECVLPAECVFPEFVAEVSSNHHRDLPRCLQFVDLAAQIGCNAVKFQLFKIEELFAPEILTRSPTHRARKLWEIPFDFIPHLKLRCQERGIQFSCTPFYLEAVDELFPYVDFYKIASYELLWNDLLTACARTGKPVVLSTGMATVDEIRQAVDVLWRSGCRDLTMLHCISGYPAPVSECNLAAVETLRRQIAGEGGQEIDAGTGAGVGSQTMKVRVGWSDHSVNPGVLYRAIHRWGVDMVEFHLDIDGTGEEFASGHCWLPEKIKTVIDQVKDGFRADGTGKKEPVQAELADRNWRRDPSDGLRPLKSVRKEWVKSRESRIPEDEYPGARR